MRYFLAIFVTFFSMLVAVPSAIAAEPEKPAAHQTTLMEKFAGTWKAEGTSFGMPSKSTMVWTCDLASKFYRIEFRIDMDNKGKTQTFIGHGYYKAGSNDGFWADTGGAMHPMATSYTGGSLTTIWGEAGKQVGRSSYTLREDGNIEVVDWILQQAGWREFNRTLFRRAK